MPRTKYVKVYGHNGPPLMLVGRRYRLQATPYAERLMRDRGTTRPEPVGATRWLGYMAG